MNEMKPKDNKMAGGIFVAAGLMGGAIIGIAYGQPSIGMVAGLAVGAAAALLVWFWDVARK
ncbi:hypothetical protein ACFOWX_10010 [Sphingorhabdus arenilitoris]|uniref:Glycine zipper family protein n=1 Tax=Sphingorhabdus arenilitoris TaxID=1490041 RepID=A0ABV8RHA6_9SPHN